LGGADQLPTEAQSADQGCCGSLDHHRYQSPQPGISIFFELDRFKRSKCDSAVTSRDASQKGRIIQLLWPAAAL
jgi:hypothetical protein